MIFQSGRFGRLTGVKYWNGQIVGDKIEKIPGVLQRGMWQYLPSEEQSKVSLDNGVNVDVFKMSQLIVKKNELIKGR